MACVSVRGVCECAYAYVSRVCCVCECAARVSVRECAFERACRVGERSARSYALTHVTQTLTHTQAKTKATRNLVSVYLRVRV